MTFARLSRMQLKQAQWLTGMCVLLLVVFPSRVYCQTADVSLSAITEAAARAADRLTIQALRRASDPQLLTKRPDQSGRAPGVQLAAYEFDSLETLLNSARKILEEPIQRPQLAGLRAFVSRFYPDTKEMKSRRVQGIPIDIIETGVAESAVTRARGVAESIRKMSSVVVDLSVTTVPQQQAVVKLEPEGGGAGHTGTADTQFKNVYRGLYVYNVSKQGMKTITRSINLVDDSRPILECRLIPESQPDGPYPCNRK